MVCLVPAIALMASLAILSCSCAQAGSANYERTYPPRMLAVTGEARSYFVEFRARDEVGGFGHSYVTLGAVEATGTVRETVVAGFMPKSAADDYWGRFGMPVTGLVGVVRSDFARRPDARFRITIGKSTYHRVMGKISQLRRTWTTYELLVQNCNNFVGQIAESAGLRTPMITAQYPVRYVAELRALNSR
jgi:hypothetical protein